MQNIATVSYHTGKVYVGVPITNLTKEGKRHTIVFFSENSKTLRNTEKILFFFEEDNTETKCMTFQQIFILVFTKMTLLFRTYPVI